MVITRATEYAVRAVLYMSKFPTGEIILKKDICATQEVTPAFLTKIFQPLVKAGLIGSQRGVGGGFYLRKDPAEITIYDIYSIEEDPLYINKCLCGRGICERDSYCPVHEAWREVRRGMIEQLKEYDFARLARQEEINLSGLADGVIKMREKCDSQDHACSE
ncbi:MAG: Rrf2 family transcriptional regulator [Desulfuromonadaceae bacterium]|nr:Rrf2 family transcriptional regulator [Desulfuromonadaceae bacterium]